MKKKKFPIVVKKKFFYNVIIKNLKNHLKNTKITKFDKNYTMEKIVIDFFENEYVKNIFKKN